MELSIIIRILAEYIITGAGGSLLLPFGVKPPRFFNIKGITMTLLNTTDSVVKRSVTGSKTLKQVVEYLRNPSEYIKATVDYARVIREVDPQAYKAIKTTKLPCLIPNFTFKNSYVKGDNVDNPTGLLYLDVDSYKDSGSVLDLNSKHIVAYWKSLSGAGYSVMVSVEGLTSDNLRQMTEYVSTELGIPFDNSAVSVDRNVVLAYDTEAVYNENAVALRLKEGNLIPAVAGGVKKVIKTVDTIYTTYGIDRCYQFRVSTKGDLQESADFNGDVLVDLGKKTSYADISFGYTKIPEGMRNRRLFWGACQYKALNPLEPKEKVLLFLINSNKRVCIRPLPKEELVGIVDSVFKKYLDGSLKIYYNKTCRYLFNPAYRLTAREKRSLIMTYINGKKTENNLNKVREYMKETGETSCTKIGKGVGLSRITVNKYKKIIELEQKHLPLKHESYSTRKNDRFNGSILTDTADNTAVRKYPEFSRQDNKDSPSCVGANYPERAPRRPVRHDLHGCRRVDGYYVPFDAGAVRCPTPWVG